MMRALYAGVTRVLEPLADPILRLRGEEAAMRRERLGFWQEEPVDVWYHAASLGEVAALTPVLHFLEERLAGHQFCVTTSTPTGRQRAQKEGYAAARLAPLDFPGCVRRSLKALSPRGLVLTETELWPNLLTEADKQKVAVGILNGRISDRTWTRYYRTRSFWRPLLRRLRAVGARTELDAQRFRDLGVSAPGVRVTGNTKHDGYRVERPLAVEWDRDKIVTLGSAHPGEGATLLPALEQLLGQRPDLRIVLAPRHLQTLSEWRSKLEHAGLEYGLWSQGETFPGGAAILLLDQHGLLMRAYAASLVSYVGGSLISRGGHNPFEASSQGTAVLMGPHHQTVSSELNLLTSSSAGRVITSPSEFAEAVGYWLDHPEEARKSGEQGRRVVRSQEGAVKTTVSWLMDRGVIPSS